MTRIQKTFASLQKNEERPALVTFTMAGDPDSQTSLELLKALPAAGADIIELGMPFTDPAADGLTIQHAGQRALAAGANMHQTLQIIRDFRKTNDTTPIVLMGYYNPIMQYGEEKFLSDASKCGIDGLIIVDLPPEEAEQTQARAKAHNIDIIRLITPTTTLTRLKTILKGASGFLYYVSITGVTGTAQADTNAIKPHIEQIKTQTDLPIAIGFGIKTPDEAAQMGKLADAIVVGSALIQTLTDTKDVTAVTTQVTTLSNALKNR